MECILRITCSEEDVLVVFPTEFDKRHDSESDKIVSPHWVVVVPILCFSIALTEEPHQRLSMVRKSRSA